MISLVGWPKLVEFFFFVFFPSDQLAKSKAIALSQSTSSDVSEVRGEQVGVSSRENLWPANHTVRLDASQRGNFTCIREKVV